MSCSEGGKGQTERGQVPPTDHLGRGSDVLLVVWGGGGEASKDRRYWSIGGANFNNVPKDGTSISCKLLNLDSKNLEFRPTT